MIGRARELDQFPLDWLAALYALVQRLEVILLTDDLSAVQGVVHGGDQTTTHTAGLLHGLQDNG